MRTSLIAMAAQVVILWLHRPVLRLGGDAIARALASRRPSRPRSTELYRKEHSAQSGRR